MKVIRFVANISYNDICKVFSVLWVETAFEDLLNSVVQEFEIPPNEATEKILCDLAGTPYTKDSFEEDVCRFISEAKVPQFRVITAALSDNAVTSSTNQSRCKEDVEQQEPEETNLNTTASNLFSNFSTFEDNLNKAENKLRPYRAEVESRIQGEPQPAEPTRSLNEPKVDKDGLKRELETRKAKLDLFQKALLEFESSLKTKEEILNRRDIDLNKLRKTLNRHDEKLKNREVKISCRRSEVASQYYSVYQLEDILYGLSNDMNTTRKHLDEHAYALNLKEAMLDQEKNKIEGGRNIVKPKGKRCKMEVASWNFDEKEDETKFNEGASTSNQQRSRDLSERVLMELETKMSKQKRRGSESSGISDEQQAKLSGPNTPMIDGQAMTMDCNEASGGADQPMKLKNRQMTQKMYSEKN